MFSSKSLPATARLCFHYFEQGMTIKKPGKKVTTISVAETKTLDTGCSAEEGKT